MLHFFIQIGDNTFPNVMGILTGYNLSLVMDQCDPTVTGALDRCPFVWNDFRASGYVTAHGEDEMRLSTFNKMKKGFLSRPTDYCMRPYMLAAEKNLKLRRKKYLVFCLGYKHSADHIYDYGMDFAAHYKNDASFGLFWTNTYSHSDVSDSSSMDLKMRDYLIDLGARGILNESMVVFFSDHGARFDSIRRLYTGWLEERLPFMFIHLPEWFRNKHPEFVDALNMNRNRLTNPFDLHMTLKHIVQLSNPDYVITPATSCPKCQSLFTTVPRNRSCKDASIPSIWCTCRPHQPHNKNDIDTKRAVQFVIDHINQILRNFTKHDNHKHRLCTELKLNTIFDVRTLEGSDAIGSYIDYLLQFETSPFDSWFESTVRFRSSIGFEINGDVTRIDGMESKLNCVDVDSIRDFCFCDDTISKQTKR